MPSTRAGRIVTLECRDDVCGRLIVGAGDADAVAEILQHLLDHRDCAALIAGIEFRTGFTCVGSTQRPTPAFDKFDPWKFFAGIVLPRRRYIRMRQHARPAEFGAARNIAA